MDRSMCIVKRMSRLDHFKNKNIIFYLAIYKSQFDAAKIASNIPKVSINLFCV